MKYAWIQDNRDQFPVRAMCRAMQVSTSGFYQSLGREPAPRARQSTLIRMSVREAHARSHGIYGSYKIAKKLQEDEHLESACRNTVATAMREMGLKSRVSKKFKPTTTFGAYFGGQVNIQRTWAIGDDSASGWDISAHAARGIYGVSVEAGGGGSFRLQFPIPGLN